MRSNRGKVVANSCRKPLRTWVSIRTVQDNRRSHKRNAWWSSLVARVSRSTCDPPAGMSETFRRIRDVADIVSSHPLSTRNGDRLSCDRLRVRQAEPGDRGGHLLWLDQAFLRV